MCERHRAKTLLGNSYGRYRNIDAPGLDSRKQSVKRDVDDINLASQSLANFLDEIDFETDVVARVVLKLPGYVADVCADSQLSGRRRAGQPWCANDQRANNN